jgi:hypothetical protein
MARRRGGRRTTSTERRAADIAAMFDPLVLPPVDKKNTGPQKIGFYRPLLQTRGLEGGMLAVREAIETVSKILGEADLDPHRPNRWQDFAAPVVARKTLESSIRRSTEELLPEALMEDIWYALPDTKRTDLTVDYTGVVEIGQGFRSSEAGIALGIKNHSFLLERQKGFKTLRVSSGVPTQEGGLPEDMHIPLFLVNDRPQERTVRSVHAAVGEILSGSDIQFVIGALHDPRLAHSETQ